MHLPQSVESPVRTLTRPELSFIEAAQAVSNPVFKAKFADLPRFLEEWSQPIGGLKDKRVMDFGCGNGTTACAVALTRQPALVVGIDINDQFHGCLDAVAPHLGIEALPDNLAFERVKPGELGTHGDFDFIYAWSVFEHIDQALFDPLVASLRDKLRVGGCLFVQIAPLYYSAEGAHLMRYGIKRWEHLSLQLDTLRARVFAHGEGTEGDKDRDWRCFETLNRMTAPELVRRISKLGFRLVRDYYTQETMLPDDNVLSVYNGSVLTTKQFVGTFQRIE